MKCKEGTECNVILPDCIEGAKDCGPKGVCVPINPEIASMPPSLVRDDPIIEIPNNC